MGNEGQAVQSFDALAGDECPHDRHSRLAELTRRRTQGLGPPIGEISLGRLCDGDHNHGFIFGHKS